MCAMVSCLLTNEVRQASADSPPSDAKESYCVVFLQAPSVASRHFMQPVPDAQKVILKMQVVSLLDYLRRDILDDAKVNMNYM
ncbi:hypothetical protein FHL15_002340 [Xylaria flabelliformis]|uniref:Uncharacterized protein n=1 Tax=Xylaria flabelliformis TaxID=2512241 RepID=A0A553I8Z6_9PEZI|nr:hypothetical protein FHL15_002340 [Xylaria flabelliformis]